MIAIGYFFAIIAYAVVRGIVAIPNGPLWDESWRAPARFLVLLLVMGAMILPAMRSEGDGAIRSGSIICTLILAAYTVLKFSGVVDPDVPEMWVMHNLVDPLRHFALGA